ncbi:uncharacterized protein V1516DRAFT_630382 [Lipomyces oligophaga]|uniref:uncharacterized protein n=1 Tax=Lipomyces oligophaga TaxID=45792 RepID=UPI0034CDCBC2
MIRTRVRLKRSLVVNQWSGRKYLSSSERPYQGLPLVNMLSHSRSPYLKAHAHNPVSWQEWEPRTLRRAAAENKVIFLSIGYHASHWCRVMNFEVFSSETIAKDMNEDFIPVKVDRELRPDLDAVYMAYLQGVGATGGWPLNVFLVPGSLEPMFAGTYWPGPWEEVQRKTGREERPVGPEMGSVLRRIKELWVTDEKNCRTAGKEAVRQLREWFDREIEQGTKSQDEVVKEAVGYFEKQYDRKFGGFGEAPKFVQAPLLRALIKLDHSIAKSSVPEEVKGPLGPGSADMAAETLRLMAKGGIRDHVGGGFARCSLSADWGVPQFEKMLSDQALLLHAYVDIWTKDRERYEFARECIEELAEYMTTGRLSAIHDGASGGIYASESSSDGYYVFTYSEIFQVMGRVNGDIAATYWGISEYGNVDEEWDVRGELVGKNVLGEHMTMEEVGKVFGMTEANVCNILESGKKKLAEYKKEKQVPPEVDRQIIASWNGMAIGALARAGIAMEGGQRWLEAAEKTASWVRDNMYDSERGVLARAGWPTDKKGREGWVDAVSDDYVWMISGLVELYKATAKKEYLEWAEELQIGLDKGFWDEQNGGGGYMPGPKSRKEEMILELKKVGDGAEPETNAIAANNLRELAGLTGHEKHYMAREQQIKEQFRGAVEEAPWQNMTMLALYY